MQKRALTTEDREAFISDLQRPFQDDLAVEVALDIMKDFKPTIIWLGGDIADVYSLASWTISREQANFGKEVEDTREFLRRLRSMFPKTRIFWQEGNHELRIRNYILKKAEMLEPMLRGSLSMDAIFHLKDLQVKYIIGPAKIGKLYHIHGHERRFTGQLVHVALNYVRWLHRNVIFGHHHVSQFFPIKEIEGSYKEAYANPCLFDISKMPYGGYQSVDLNMRGISLVTYAKSDWFHVEQLTFVDTKNGYLVMSGSEMREYTSGEHRKTNIFTVK